MYVKAEADGSDVPMNQGETYVEYAKIEGSNITTKRVGESLTTQSTNSYKQKYGILPSDIPYEIDLKSLSSLKNSPQSKYYEIDETLTAGEFSKYKKNITVTGGSAPREMSITLKIKINKTYGYLESITATETYKIERAGFEASATSNISIKFKYSGIKTSAIEEIKSQLN